MIVVHEQVRQALAEGRPVVAMESTIYSTLGLPVPHNAEALRRCSAAVEAGGAVPAVTAVVDGAWRVGLDADEVDTALIDGRHILVVDADQAEGKAIGVTGTPTYVIGGERLDGGKSQEGLRERIEEIADRLLAGQDA